MKIFSSLLLLLCLPLFLPAQAVKTKALKGLEAQFEASELFDQIFTGFALYDPESKAFLFEKDAHQYYTPASNTKILTFLTSLKVLGDSITALRYIEKEDSIFFWGTGNPLFLHPAFPEDSAAYVFLKNTDKHLFFSDHNFKGQRFGPGWAWDDYSGYYQVEKSAFPMYANMATFERKKKGEGFVTHPARLQQQLSYDPQMDNSRIRMRRDEHNNTFRYNSRALTGHPFKRTSPFFTSAALTAQLLSDTLGRKVQLAAALPEGGPVQCIKLPLRDTLFRRLMQDSDNFIAEQLLMACSEKLTGDISDEAAIQFAKDSLFREISAQLIWRDGSGLSRYNLFTPRALVGVLSQLYESMPTERLTKIFPAGGKSGTIVKYYQHKSGPYVFAKTGTLSNKHCLSGYLKAASGKWYIFSFMNNNYVNGSGEVKREMEKVLLYIRDNF
jgi:D-alanyl-D-alanine carboxypeptidase/D-alanyl-D-alanine-endopeptidase (penicillin-binding protein 4)